MQKSSGITHLLILGCGYVGARFGAGCLSRGMKITVTTRSQEHAGKLEKMGMTAVVAATPEELSGELLATVDAVLDSIPLTRNGNTMYASQPLWLPGMVAKLSNVKWAGYLSTTGVYGDAQGAWVDESCRCRPESARGLERLVAERCWLESGLAAEVFRLAGIYGPERNILGRLKAGDYKAVAWQPEHWSNRIHVDDIVAALMAAMLAPRAGRVVNLTDDEPLPHVDYVIELAEMVGAPKPHVLDEKQGEQELSPKVLEFFRDSKRVSNRVLHDELLPDLHYPSFRSAVHTLER